MASCFQHINECLYVVKSQLRSHWAYYGRLRGSAYKWLDVVALSDSIIRIQDPTSSVDAVKLFTAHALVH